MSSSILILGAGIYQVPLIRTAQRMGLRAVVASIEGDYPGIPLADAFYPVDTRDYKTLLEIARAERIAGVCTSGTDVAVRSIGYICDALNLPGISREAAERVTDKARMKEALVAAGVSTAVFEKVRSLAEARRAACALGYPVVVKAVDSSGSRGIVKAVDDEELAVAFDDAMAVSGKDYLLVEQFIDAPEIGIDGYVGPRGIEAFFPHTKFTHRVCGATVPVGHAFPYRAESSTLMELRSQFDKAIAALGLKNCPFNADVFVGPQGISIIEIGGRTGATCIPELISLYRGFDWYRKIIESALGVAPNFASAKCTPCMAKMIFSPIDDAIASINEARLEKLRDKGFMCQIDFPPGHRVEALADGTGRIGHLIAPVSDPGLFDAYLAEFRSCIELASGNLEELWETVIHE